MSHIYIYICTHIYIWWFLIDGEVCSRYKDYLCNFGGLSLVVQKLVGAIARGSKTTCATSVGDRSRLKDCAILVSYGSRFKDYLRNIGGLSLAVPRVFVQIPQFENPYIHVCEKSGSCVHIYRNKNDSDDDGSDNDNDKGNDKSQECHAEA